jgi:hypothetical protein
MIPDDTHLPVGSPMFEGMDQIDLTGPFEALSRVPNSTYQIYAKTGAPVRDLTGLLQTDMPWLRRYPARCRSLYTQRGVTFVTRTVSIATVSIHGAFPK